MRHITSLIASTLRGWKGSHATARTNQPDKLLELYDMEGCPFCRPVREYLTELDLDVLIHPCPKKSTRNREKLSALGGKKQMPYLYDPNTDTGLYEMQDIIVYLKNQYDTLPQQKKTEPNVITSTLASMTRAMSGILYRPSLPADKPLELFSYEANVKSRIVRERLTEMEISYVLRNSGKTQIVKSEPIDSNLSSNAHNQKPSSVTPLSKRQELHQRTGKIQIPYLYDPNSDKGLFEPKDIIHYLKCTYGKTPENIRIHKEAVNG